MWNAQKFMVRLSKYPFIIGPAILVKIILGLIHCECHSVDDLTDLIRERIGSATAEACLMAFSQSCCDLESL